MQPLDRFSGHANLYAQYRIDYPAELYDFVLSFTRYSSIRNNDLNLKKGQ
jgi:hypothetical protein